MDTLLEFAFDGDIVLVLPADFEAIFDSNNNKYIVTPKVNLDVDPLSISSARSEETKLVEAKSVGKSCANIKVRWTDGSIRDICAGEIPPGFNLVFSRIEGIYFLVPKNKESKPSVIL